MIDSTFFLFIIFLVAAIIVFVPLFVFFRFFRRKADINKALNMSLFLVTLPKKAAKKDEGEAPKNRKEIISVMEQFYASLANLRGAGLFSAPPHLVFEIATPHHGEEICFYLAVPRRYQELIEKQIHGFYPEARVEKTEDYNIFNPQGAVSGAYLKLARDYCLPFKTYQNLETDPLNEIVNTISKREEVGEGAAIQILMRPTQKKWKVLGLRIAKKMQKGKSYGVAKDEAVFFSIRKLIGLIESAGTDPAKKRERELKQQGPGPLQLTPLQQETIKALENKASKVGFETNIRIIVSALTQERANQLLGHLESAFAQFNAPNLNQLKSGRVSGRAIKKLIYNFSFRIFDSFGKSLLNTEELTSLFHFSTSSVEAPKVKFLKAKPASPPPTLP